GFKEIFITNGIVKDLLDQDYTDFYFVTERMRQIYREKGAVIKEMIDHIPSVPIPNYMFTHQGDLQFSNVSNQWGLGTPGFSSGAAYGDMDDDGDLDLVVSNINSPPHIYRNESQALADRHFVNIRLIGPEGNRAAVGSQVIIKSGARLFFQELYPMRGSMSCVDPRLHFGLGSISMIDTLEIIWPDGRITTRTSIPTDQFLTFNHENSSNKEQVAKEPFGRFTLLKDITNQAGIDFRHHENEFVDFNRDKLLFHMVTSEGPKLAIGDVNSDGLSDFYIGGAKEMPGVLYSMDETGAFRRTNAGIFEKEKGSEDIDALFFDADNDGDQDLMVASGGYEFSGSSFALADRLYTNDGNGNFSTAAWILPDQKLCPTSCLAKSDYDKDGDWDLFLGVRFKPFSYGIPSSSYLMENDGKGNFKNVSHTKAPALEDVGMVT
ncbi:MAG: VCBS repeat-containing protein, partial [Bacteroidales bacterium]|nr:VCBS repeat-containing protein [Bacteroidales bacterium]